jgi:hypothetical protein
MLIGYLRISSESDRQSTDLQRDALLAAGVDARHLLERLQVMLAPLKRKAKLNDYRLKPVGC